MLLRRAVVALGGVAVLVGLLAGTASAMPAPDQQLPFSCGEQWTGTTRATHRPSPNAVDFNAPDDLGKIVVASGPGVVSRVEDTGSTSYGKWIRIEHPDGYATLYAHLKAQWVVPGQYVDQGTPIGRVGDTGGVSGAHLHYEQRSGSTVVGAYFDGVPFVYGSTVASANCPDVPLAGDWNGDRADEVAVFRRDAGAGTFQMYSPDATTTPVRFGRPSDLPVAGDWDGDGTTDVGVRRQGARLFLLRAADGTATRRKLGAVKDVPVTGDWDGNGTTDLGVWRPVSARFRLLQADGTELVVPLGTPGSQPVTGDWDGDGTTDLGVFDAATATFSLRTVTADGQVVVTSVPLGATTDLPVAGDWNGDGITDVGTWAPATATYTLRVTPTAANARRSTSTQPEIRTLTFGRPR